MKVGITAEAPGAEINSSLEAFGQICHCWTFAIQVCNTKIMYINRLDGVLYTTICSTDTHVEVSYTAII